MLRVPRPVASVELTSGLPNSSMCAASAPTSRGGRTPWWRACSAASGVGERKILVASLTYAILSSLVFTAIGFGIGQAVS
jgi:hypothetical protein